MRWQASAAFAVAGGAAAAIHVLAETDGALREWRQTPPLAAMLGAALGWAAAPFPPATAAAARRGALAATIALAAFIPIFALGHGSIEAMRGAANLLGETGASALRAGRAMIGPTGLATPGLGALAGAATTIRR